MSGEKGELRTAEKKRRVERREDVQHQVYLVRERGEDANFRPLKEKLTNCDKPWRRLVPVTTCRMENVNASLSTAPTTPNTPRRWSPPSHQWHIE
ncbi:hypothetical protein ElyMa_001062200 [Elysia marginata]|uniref:Uncharacterized protein n=1 Tax=Elysia marginata TaxID=1093978 RepID=A0AAV4HQ83_9GAST|nr:hypothetical protein ElyMa_001062200 [Elysia marginata]